MGGGFGHAQPVFPRCSHPFAARERGRKRSRGCCARAWCEEGPETKAADGKGGSVNRAVKCALLPTRAKFEVSKASINALRRVIP